MVKQFSVQKRRPALEEPEWSSAALFDEQGRVRAQTIGQIEDRPRDWLKTRSQGRLCPICLEPISDRSQTCKRHIGEWKALLRDPYQLARWIADVAAEWRRGNRLCAGGWLHVWTGSIVLERDEDGQVVQVLRADRDEQDLP